MDNPLDATARATERRLIMAEAKECDRCGELYKCQCDIPIIGISVYYPTTGEKEIDLCPKCKKAILDWLKQPSEGE